MAVITAGSSARADVGVVLNESLDSSAEWVTGSGHTAVYFSRICAASPIRLRLCKPGEDGSVMSTYVDLGEDHSYGWNIVPLNVYVFGAEDPDHRPVFGSEKIKALLEQSYLNGDLSGYCASEGCRTGAKAEWREMVGASMVRSIYIFLVRTTVQQDLDIIARFNDLPNQNHFNGITRNCADFVKGVVDTYFPHAAHRDVINDFGMTSPKAVARTFSHYALTHPGSQFRVLHFSQVPGTIKRSSAVHSGTEQLYRSKKLLLPMAIFADHELPIVAAAYLFTGRFNPEREFEQHPALEFAADSHPALEGAARFASAKLPTDGVSAPAMRTLSAAEIVGSPAQWKQYRKKFDLICAEAVREEIIPDRNFVRHFFARLNKLGTPSLDAQGDLWIEVPEGDRTARLGISSDNLFSPHSDSHLAFDLMLARVDEMLRSPKHSRETMAEFEHDWALLEYARMTINKPPTVTAPLLSSRTVTVARPE